MVMLMLIDITEWKEFKIDELFLVKRPNARSVQMYETGDVPFVSSGNYDNGVDSYREPFPEEELDLGNCISVSPVDGSAFYQPINFLGRGGGGSSIILLYNQRLNEYNGLFISSVIRKTLTQNYFYGDMGSSESIKNEYIKLPVDEEGQPDWVYMDNKVAQLIEEIKSSISAFDMMLKRTKN